MDILDATVDSTDVDNDQRLLEPSVASQEEKFLSEQTVSKQISLTDAQTSQRKSTETAPRKAPPKTAPKQSKPANTDLSRKTSDARQKLLSTQKSQLQLEVSRGQTLKSNRDDQRKQQSREDQQLQKRPVQQKSQRLPKQRKKRRRSCCGGESPERNVDNDARHIEAIIASQQQSSKCCCAPLCCCCCRQPKRRDNQMQQGSACSRCCKKFLAFLFSHIGLCSMVVAYAIMGGFLFRWLEASDEIEERIMISRKRNNSISRVGTPSRVLENVFRM